MPNFITPGITRNSIIPMGTSRDSTFGQILKVREGPRVMQFGLKFLF